MKSLFETKTLIAITVIILSCTAASTIIQVFFVHSKQKDRNHAVMNSHIVNYMDAFSDTICDGASEHGFLMYLFCTYEGGVYFSYEDNPYKIEKDIGEFLRFGETVVKKQAKDTKVYFVNEDDTLKINFEVDMQTGVLINGLVYN